MAAPHVRCGPGGGDVTRQLGGATSAHFCERWGGGDLHTWLRLAVGGGWKMVISVRSTM